MLAHCSAASALQMEDALASGLASQLNAPHHRRRNRPSSSPHHISRKHRPSHHSKPSSAAAFHPHPPPSPHHLSIDANSPDLELFSASDSSPSGLEAAAALERAEAASASLSSSPFSSASASASASLNARAAEAAEWGGGARDAAYQHALDAEYLELDSWMSSASESELSAEAEVLAEVGAEAQSAAEAKAQAQAQAAAELQAGMVRQTDPDRRYFADDGMSCCVQLYIAIDLSIETTLSVVAHVSFACTCCVVWCVVGGCALGADGSTAHRGLRHKPKHCSLCQVWLNITTFDILRLQKVRCAVLQPFPSLSPSPFVQSLTPLFLPLCVAVGS
jgi:hypothetical protein